MPSRSLGRCSRNSSLTFLTTEIRLAGWLPIVKSSASIDPETSSNSMMSMPLASTWVIDLPFCGRASAMMSNANAQKNKPVRKLPARLCTRLPRDRSASVEEKTTVGEPPGCPRRNASNGTSNSSSNNHGFANVMPKSSNGFIRQRPLPQTGAPAPAIARCPAPSPGRVQI